MGFIYLGGCCLVLILTEWIHHVLILFKTPQTPCVHTQSHTYSSRSITAFRPSHATAAAAFLMLTKWSMSYTGPALNLHLSTWRWRRMQDQPRSWGEMPAQVTQSNYFKVKEERRIKNELLLLFQWKNEQTSSGMNHAVVCMERLETDSIMWHWDARQYVTEA